MRIEPAPYCVSSYNSDDRVQDSYKEVCLSCETCESEHWKDDKVGAEINNEPYRGIYKSLNKRAPLRLTHTLSVIV